MQKLFVTNDSFYEWLQFNQFQLIRKPNLNDKLDEVGDRIYLANPNGHIVCAHYSVYGIRVTSKVENDPRGNISRVVDIGGKAYRVSRLIAEMFIPNIYRDCAVVRHKNGRLSDNRVVNLQWVPRSRWTNDIEE